MQDTQDNISLYQKVKYKFDLITSNNGTNWLLALNWILVLEFLSAIMEYQFVDIAKNFVTYIPHSLQKELLIAVMIVLFIWYSIYNFIFMKKEQFFVFTLYLSICVYLLSTNDLSFNLLAHNLNIFEITIDGFGFYMLFQLFLKFIIFYLIFKMIIALKNRNKQL
ncbi:MAG: hypothetical protein KBE77_03070 [Aliarcobacter sp.]|nr:hypothetical protein [Aliarcobacter sp.]